VTPLKPSQLSFHYNRREGWVTDNDRMVKTAYYDRMVKVGSIQGLATVEIDHDIGVGVLIWETSGTKTLLAMSKEMVGPFTIALRDALVIVSREHRQRG
jgi:hypothetical protein